MPRQTANSQRAGLPLFPNPESSNPVPSPDPIHGSPMAHTQEVLTTLGSTSHPDPNLEPGTSNPQPIDSHTEISPEPPVSDLTVALSKLAESLSSPKTSGGRTKVREPDTFDGSDAWKLQPFIVQCTLNFHDRPDVFSNDSAKVIYALSYLKGSALDWFKPGLTSEDKPDWLHSYSEFLSELRINFGPHNPEADAEAELETLWMRDNQRITRYNVDFNHLAPRVKWGESALLRQYYMGLPARIKDEFVHVGKPDTLSGLRNRTHTIDD